MNQRGKNKVKWIRYQRKKSQKGIKRKKLVRKRRKKSIALTQEERRIANINEKKYSQEERRAEKDLKRKYKLTNNYKVVKAPKLFSFLRNTIEVLEFIEKLEKNIDLKKSTFVDLQNVDEIDHDAIVVLRSIMARFESKKITFNGNVPDDNNAKNILIESGFFESLSHNNKAITKDLIKKGSIHTHKDLRVNSELADFLIGKASKTVWNKEMRCPKIFRMFIELMGNTHEHASRGRQGEKYWYMCVHHLKDENKVIFAFVDYGMGILKSIQQKQPDDKGFEHFRRLWYKIRWN